MASKKAFRAQSTLRKVQSTLFSMQPATISMSQAHEKTFTLTFGDMAENHVGMQKIGSLAQSGFDLVDMQRAKNWFASRGIVCEMTELNQAITDPYLEQSSEKAYILIARQGLNALLGRDDAADVLYVEQDLLPKDTQARMYGRVVNKHARHNLCFGPVSHTPHIQYNST